MQEQTEQSSAEDTKPIARDSDQMGSPGASTFGFETLLGKLVVDTGLVTTDELRRVQWITQRFFREMLLVIPLQIF